MFRRHHFGRKTGGCFWTILAITTLFSFFPTTMRAVEDDAIWTFVYEPKVLPNDPENDPPWRVPLEPSPEATSIIEDGKLVISTGPLAEDWNFYRMDGGIGKPWSPNADGSTVEVKLKVLGRVSGDGTSQSLIVATGAYQYHIGFSPNGLALTGEERTDLPMPTTDDAHVYRFVFRDGGEMDLFVDHSPEPIFTILGKPTKQSFMDFGDCSQGQGGSCEWSYLKWTNAGAFPPAKP